MGQMNKLKKHSTQCQQLMNWLGLWESAESAHVGCRPYDAGSKHLATYAGKNVIHECQGS